MTYPPLFDPGSCDYLDLSVRSENRLKDNNILSLKDLLAYSEDELLSFRCMGKTVLNEIKEKLQDKGYSLAPNPDYANLNDKVTRKKYLGTLLSIMVSLNIMEKKIMAMESYVKQLCTFFEKDDGNAA